ncbi:MAG: dTMP kinase [Peptococcaceae bacterium]
MYGKFITFEGSDGSGKSTQIALLKKVLEDAAVPFKITREPGGTVISEEIRSIILDDKYKEMIWRTEALLYAASRAQLVGQLIIPALEAGIHVLCDRYIDSTLAYQGYGRGLDIRDLTVLNDFAADNLEPDLTILLDIDPEETLGRRSDRKADRLEKEKPDFHKKVRQGYLKLAETEPDRFVIVSGNRDIMEIHHEIKRIVLPVLNGHK